MSNTKSTSSNEIVIDISKSVNPTFFENDGIIHQTDFRRVSSWIGERLDELRRVKDTEPQENQARYNDTISILGSRGSGKTSFLMSLIQKYKKSEDLEVIEIIDPTLIEEKGHIFLTILSLIQEKVMDKLKDGCYELENINYRVREEWDSKLKKLSEGIPSIDGIGQDYQSADWMSAEHIMNKGLKSVMAAKKLESNFNKLVDCSLRILDKKAFLFIFDDIDIDFRKGWPVLETIRKYMTSARIITLLSGDLRLYSKAIRKQQWKNFGKALLKNEAEYLKRIEDYDSLVTEMEGQYLQKVIRPERRIYLKTLQEKKDRYNQLGIEVINAKEDKPLKIEVVYNLMLQQNGIFNTLEANPYQAFLLNLPLRSQIQLLAEFFANSNQEDSVDVAKVFLSDLINKGVDIDLANSNHKMIIPIILKLLLKNDLLINSYQLQPTTSNNSINASFISLSFLLSNRIKRYPELIFEYFIKIGYFRNLTFRNVIASKMQSMINYSSLLQENELKGIAAKFTAFIQGSLVQKRQYESVIPLYYVKEDQPVEIEGALAHLLGILPIARLDKGNVKMYYCSIYYLLGVLGDLVKNATDIESVEDILHESAQMRIYRVPESESVETLPNSFEFDTESNDNTTFNSNKEKSFMRLLLRWIQDLKGLNVSPHLLGKISTRLFTSLNNLQDHFKKKGTYLGDAMHLSIASYFNAVLIEEVREKGLVGFQLSLNNLKSSHNDFYNNLKKVVDKAKDSCKNLVLTRHMLSCPLFWVYLNPTTEESTSISKVIVNFLETTTEKGGFLFQVYSDSSNRVEGEQNFSICENLKYFEEFNLYSNYQEIYINTKTFPDPIPFRYGRKFIDETLNQIKEYELWQDIKDLAVTYNNKESSADTLDSTVNLTYQLLHKKQLFNSFLTTQGVKSFLENLEEFGLIS